jgi:hypothetical protein
MKKNLKFYSLEKAVNNFLQELDPRIHYLQLLREQWSNVLGSSVCEKIEPCYWKKNTLVVAVQDVSYAHYVRMRSETIASQVRVVLKNDFCRGVEAVQKRRC